MRILHLDSGRDMRGGQWQSLRLHEGLLQRGHESTLLRRDEMKPWRISQRFDIVHAHDARSHTVAALFARAPLVVSRRVAFPIRKSMASRWKYGRVRLFIAVSNYVARGLGELRTEVVYDGVPLPDELAHGEDWVVMAHKGAELAHRAATMAGVVLRTSTNLEHDLRTARGMVYLSESEGLGSGILLAMAHGVPVIASNVGGIPEIVRDGVNGLLIPNEVDALARAFGAMKAEMSRAARETVEARFTVDHMVEGTLAAYRKVLS